MARTVKVRTPTDEERRELERLAHHGRLGRRPGAGRGVAAGGRRARLRHPGQPQHPPRARRLALRLGPPALVVRLPAAVRRLPQSDRAVVEGAALARAQGAALRVLGRALACRRTRDRLLERPQASVHLGPSAAPPAAPPARRRRRAVSRLNLPDEPLSTTR